MVEPELNELFGEGPAGAAGAWPALSVTPSSEAPLENGSVEITFDGRRSHDGSCDQENLAFAWEKLSGPVGATFAGPADLPVLSVVFTEAGEYLFRLTVSSEELPDSENSRDFILTITDEPAPGTVPFLRCDSNIDGEITLADAVFTLRHLFLGDSDIRCGEAMDCDSDGEISLSDAVFNLNYLFLGGAIPASPFPACDSGAAENCETSNCPE